MVMAPMVKAILGSFAFAVFWVLAVFPAVPFMPIGRTAGSLLGAMLMVLFQVIKPDDAYKAIDLQILGLLFGTMVVSVYLERADLYKYLATLLSWKSQGSKDLLCRICLLSAIFSAFFTNDTSCVVLTEFVLEIARQQNLPPHPFLLALASSANIGSSATPIGNPQNLVIAIRSKIPFSEFLFRIMPAMVMGICVNALILLCMFWKSLSIQIDEKEPQKLVPIPDNEMNTHKFSPSTMSHPTSQNSQELTATLEPMSVQCSPGVNGTIDNTPRNHIIPGDNDILKHANDSKGVAENGSLQKKYIRVLSNVSSENGFTNASSDLVLDEIEEKSSKWKIGVYLITLGMLVSFLVGINMSWTAIAAALALVVLDFKDARPSLEKVSYSLLVFFCGMFVTVDGFKSTGIPDAVWDIMETHAIINHITGVAILAVVIIVLSNLVSNVPTVLLLGVKVAKTAAIISPQEGKKAWLILAWVSTVAGNLSLLGSAANLIVCEEAQRFGYNITFWAHLKFGVPSTLIVTAIGLTLIMA